MFKQTYTLASLLCGKYAKHLCLLSLALLLMSAELYAKKPKRCHKRVGYFASRNPDKLVSKLCRNLETDSAKVAAIYCWIISNLKYDYTKFEKQDFRVVNARNILKQRKAICYGYATLFKELCSKAGIKAVIVNGYSKNNSVDICDSFFLEDHAWNAVRIDDKWYLCDLTWDGGYHTYWRRTFKGSLLYVFSFGKIDKMYLKPKFVKRPAWNFFLKPGDYFAYDHLPANPIWQLKSDISSPVDFKNDSSWWYRSPRSMEDTYSEEYENERNSYADATDSLNEITDGYAYNAFNYRNHYQITVAKIFQALPYYRSIDFRSKDSAFQLEMADSVISYANQTLMHADSNRHYILQQHAMLINHLKLKNDKLKTDNKTLRKSSERLNKFATKGKRFRGKLSSYVNRTFKINRQSLENTFKNEKIYDPKKPSRTNEEDSADIINKLDSVDALLQLNLSKLDSMQDGTDSILFRLYPQLGRAVNFEYNKAANIKVAWLMRMLWNVDDLDYQMTLLKDSLLKKNRQNDSIFFNGSMDIMDSIHHCFKRINTQYKFIFRLSKEKLKLYRQLKNKCSAGSIQKITASYQAEKIGMYKTLNDYNAWQKNFILDLESLNDFLHELKQGCRKSIRQCRLERRFKLKPRHIHLRRNALLRLNTYRSRFANIELRKALRAKEKFKRKKR